MTIALMNERITIQKSAVTTDQYGNHKKGWTDYFTCWAYASTFSQDEKESAAVTLDERGITFEVRYCSQLKPVDSVEYRVVFHDEIYDIQSVDMMNWQRKAIKLKCRKADRVKVSNGEQNSNNGTVTGGSGTA